MAIRRNPDTVAELVRSRAGDPHVGLQLEGERWTWAEVESVMKTKCAPVATTSSRIAATSLSLSVQADCQAGSCGCRALRLG